MGNAVGAGLGLGIGAALGAIGAAALTQQERAAMAYGPMAPTDPHSTDGVHPVVSHAALAFYLNFAASTIHASVVHHLLTPQCARAALHRRRRAPRHMLDPLSSDHRDAYGDELWCAPGCIIEEFQME